MHDQGPLTPSPDSEVALDDEKISPSLDHDSKSLESCRARFQGTDFKPFPGMKRIHAPQVPTTDPKAGTQDPSPAIPELFPLNANFQSK